MVLYHLFKDALCMYVNTFDRYKNQRTCLTSVLRNVILNLDDLNLK